ncbi:MAG: Uroporphyrinogen-III synthase [Chloroflexi bacterium]|nr:Uroporphyrinogen-III synthase [Chloroflexota bacterium]
MKGPLSGRTVLVTRPHEQAARLSDALIAEGASPIEVPAIRIAAPVSWAPLDSAIQRGSYDWVVFTSANAVRFFFERLSAAGTDEGWFHGGRVAAIGPQTAETLRVRGVPVDLVPDEFVAEALVACLADAEPLSGRRVLLPRADIARDALVRGLQNEGADVEAVVAYRTEAADAPPLLLDQLARGQIEIATFTSSSTVRALMGIVGGRADLLQRVVVACIGPITAGTAHQVGLDPRIVANTYTIPGLISAMRDYFSGDTRGKTGERHAAVQQPD